MKVNTETLKNALSFLSMGISTNSDKYETQLIEFEISNGKLKGFTNNGTDKLGMRICDSTDTFNAVLKFADLFNLIKACKDEEIEMKSGKNYVQFTTKTISCRLSVFDHKIERPIMPKYDKKVNGEKLKDCLPVIKSILNPAHVEECYRYVYFSDYVMVTDTDNVAVINEKLFNNILMSLRSIEILSTLGEFDYITNGKEICAFNDNKIVETLLKDSSHYQYTELLGLFAKLNNKISLTKDTLNNAISLASIFNADDVDLVFDTNGARLEIPANSFVYQLSTSHCIDKKYTLPLSLLKKFSVIGENLNIGIDSDDFISVEDSDNNNVKALFGVTNED